MTGRCPVCGATRRLRADGGLYAHDGDGGRRCPGSRQPPGQPDPADPYPPAEPTCRWCAAPADPDLSPVAGWCSTEHQAAGRATYRRRRADLSRRRRGVTTPWRRMPSNQGA